MKTIFSIGFAPQQTFFFGYRLGQDEALMNLQKADHDKFLSDINRAAEEWKAINAWKASDANWQKTLDKDFDKFQADILNAGEFAGTALGTQANLNLPGPYWTVSSKEWNDANSWVIMVDDAFKFMVAHAPSAGGKIASGTPPPPASPVSPVVIGVGAAALIGLAIVAVG